MTLDKAIRWTFYALALFLPFSISGAQAALALLCLLLVVRAGLRRQIPHPGEPAGWLIVALVGWVLLAAPFALYPDLTWPRLAKYWIWLTYFVALASFGDWPTARRAVSLLVFAAGATAIYGIAQHIFGDAVPRYFVPPVTLWQKTGGYYHAVGMFDHHLTYGNNLIIIILLGMGLWFETQPWRQRIALGIALLLCTFGLLWSYARSAWIGLVAGLMIFAGLKGKRAVIITLAVISLLGLAAVKASPTLADRIQRAFISEKNLERIYTWKTTVDMIVDHPVTGIGPGAYRTLTELYRQNYNIHWTARSHAHNSYLQIAAESGLAAGLVFTALIVTLFALGIAHHRDISCHNPGKNLLAGAVGACTAFAAASLLQHNAGDAEVCMVFLFAAALLVFLVKSIPKESHDAH